MLRVFRPSAAAFRPFKPPAKDVVLGRCPIIGSAVTKIIACPLSQRYSTVPIFRACLACPKYTQRLACSSHSTTRATQPATGKCEKCGHAMRSSSLDDLEEIVGRWIRCSKCHSIASPPPITTNIRPSYFDVLLPSRKTTTASSSLSSRGDPGELFNSPPEKSLYLRLQQLVHPDRFTDTDSNKNHAKVRAQGWSAWISKGWRTLQDPLSRAEYLHYLLYSPPSASSNSASIDEWLDQQLKDVPDDDEALQSVFAVHEQLASGNVDGHACQLLRQGNAERIEGDLGELSAAFHRKDRTRTSQLIARLRYWYTLRDRIDDLQ